MWGSGSPCATRLSVGELRESTLSVVKSPYLSFLASLTAARCHNRLSLAIRSSAATRGGFALPPLLSPSPKFIPYLVSNPDPALHDSSIEDELECLLDHDPSELQAELESTFGSRIPERWQPAAKEPRRWIEAFVWAAQDACRIFDPIWKEAQWLIEREIARIGVAVVRNSVDLVLNGLDPGIRYAQGHIQYGNTDEKAIALGSRRFVMVPTVSPKHCPVIGFDMPVDAYLAYPVPVDISKRVRASERERYADSDALEVVLGPLRARLLRSACIPLTMGQLATQLDCSGRTITYHCDWLEEAGLVLRERRGQAVILHRTARGDELVDVLTGDRTASS
jgi:DNA-binding transcriptional ArsR family regulator